MCFGALGWGHGFGVLGALFGGLITLLFWGVLIALAFFAVRALTRSAGARSVSYSNQPSPTNDRALAIVKERYARGEIDKEMYDRLRGDLLA